MGVIITLCIGAVLWVGLWAIGAKAFDVFMLVIVLLVMAAAAHIFAPLLPGNRAKAQPRPDNPPFT